MQWCFQSLKWWRDSFITGWNTGVDSELAERVGPIPSTLTVLLRNVVGLKYKEMKLWKRIKDQINLPFFDSVLRFSISFWRFIENNTDKLNGHTVSFCVNRTKTTL